MAACCPTCGAPAPAPVQAARNSVQVKPGPRPLASLVTSPDIGPMLTAYREVDTHTAMARGLAEYLGQQSIDIGGRRLQLTTYTTWAEPEATVSYPALAIGGQMGTYSRNLTPDVVDTLDKDLRLVSVTEFSQDLLLDLWTTDPKERAFLTTMLEEALNPVDWMYGFRLILPFYHGATAVYELLSSQFLDNSDDAIAKYRRTQFTVRGTITAYRTLRFPSANPVARVDEIGVSVVLPTTN